MAKLSGRGAGVQGRNVLRVRLLLATPGEVESVPPGRAKVPRSSDQFSRLGLVCACLFVTPVVSACQDVGGNPLALTPSPDSRDAVFLAEALPNLPSLLNQYGLDGEGAGEADAWSESWELEPGARVYDAMALPTPMDFDAPHRLDAFLNAVRWGAASSADVRVLQAPFRSGIDIEEYQLDPLVRAIQMPPSFGLR